MQQINIITTHLKPKDLWEKLNVIMKGNLGTNYTLVMEHTRDGYKMKNKPPIFICALLSSRTDTESSALLRLSEELCHHYATVVQRPVRPL